MVKIRTTLDIISGPFCFVFLLFALFGCSHFHTADFTETIIKCYYVSGKEIIVGNAKLDHFLSHKARKLW